MRMRMGAISSLLFTALQRHEKLIEHRISTCNLDFYTIHPSRVCLVVVPHSILLIIFITQAQWSIYASQISTILFASFGSDRPLSLTLHD
jgi:hypothetical protein